jgi:undecaprenyl diphosphate synthase
MIMSAALSSLQGAFKNNGQNLDQKPALEKALQHVAIIMDGNGRWAESQGLPRVVGHQRGVQALRAAIEGALEHGIKFLTVFAFSSENWKRPLPEVQYLMRLIQESVIKELPDLIKNDIRVQIIGNRTLLSPETRRSLEQVEAQTQLHKALTLVIAISYGARQEIAETARKLAERVKKGDLQAEEITPDMFASHLETSSVPDPDFLIRTSGEKRVSNFLLWQLSYSELIFMDVFWPDFSKDHFAEAIQQFYQRNRRFGLVQPPATHKVDG